MLIALWLAVAGADEGACRAAEAELRLDDALVACGACAEAPGPRSAWCGARVGRLLARTDADGGLATLTALEGVRARWSQGDPDALRAEVDALAGRAGLAPTLAAELAIWRATDSRRRLDDADGALAITAAAWPAPPGVDPSVVRLLGGLHAGLLAEGGQLDAARAVEAAVRVPVAEGAARPTRVDQVVAGRWRRWGAAVSAAALLAFAAIAGPLAWRGERRWPLGLIPLVAGVAAAMAVTAWWAPGEGGALPWIGAGWVAVHLVSARALARGRWRPVLRGAAALATLAVAYLVLWWRSELGWVGL